MMGLGFMALLTLVAIFAPIVAPYSPTEIPRPIEVRASPSAEHWFGTDTIGRDVFSRVVYGAAISLRIGIIATAISLLIGVVLGALSGYFSGVTDTVIMRITDALLAIPYIVLAIAIATMFGRSENSVILVLGLTGWLAITRIVRANFLSLKRLEYVEAAPRSAIRGRASSSGTYSRTCCSRLLSTGRSRSEGSSWPKPRSRISVSACRTRHRLGASWSRTARARSRTRRTFSSSRAWQSS